MNIVQYIIALTIAILYPFFWHKLSDAIVRKYVGDTDCKYPYSLILNDGEKPSAKDDEKEYKKCQTRIKYMESVRFIVLLIVAVIGIFISMAFEEKAITVGLSIGGLISALVAVTLYWNNMGEITKVTTIGASLATLIAIPYYVDIKKTLVE